MPIKITAAGQSDAGRQREKNEDWFYLRVVQSLQEELNGLFVVADGMGGHSAGDVASKTVVTEVFGELKKFDSSDRSALAIWDVIENQKEMAKVTEGLGLPPGMNLPF